MLISHLSMLLGSAILLTFQLKKKCDKDRVVECWSSDKKRVIDLYLNEK